MSYVARDQPPGVRLEACPDAPCLGVARRPCDACLRPGGLELTDKLLQLAALPSGAVVLDVGCGSGATVAHLADRHGLRALGVDASLPQIARARRARPDLDYVAGRAGSLPFSDGTFDAVLAECVLSTLPDAASALAEMARVLRPGGRALVSDLYSRAGDGARAKGSIPSLGRREAAEGLLLGAGFEVVCWEDHTGVLARLFWDLAGSGVPSCGSVAPRTSPPGAPPRRGRRLGYFICVAHRPRAGRGEHEGGRA